MATTDTTISQTAASLQNDKLSDEDYWWRTSGSDLTNMLNEAGYPEEVQHRFLDYFRQTICPQLGRQPTPDSAKGGLAWDGSPFEYSFELKSTSPSVGVRFGVDLGDLGPPNDDENRMGPLDTTGPEKVVKTLAGRAIDFDDSYYHSLNKFFDQSHQSKSKQIELVEMAGHQTPVVIGFDLNRRLPSDLDALPAMGKVYFAPCHYAAAKGISRWEAMSQAIHQLPQVESYPNIIKSLNIIGDYLATKPDHWKHGGRYLATDFVAPGKARLKIYMRYPGESFEEIWDYYTLGGRIPNQDDDKEQFRDLVELTGPASKTGGMNLHLHFTNFRRKLTCIYFSLSPDNPTPAPKIGVFPANFAENDGVIARGLDTWLQKYNWPVPKKRIEDQIKSVFPHRSLDEKIGLFSFLSFGRKEDPTKKDLSMQIYLTPELYSHPRML